MLKRPRVRTCSVPFDERRFSLILGLVLAAAVVAIRGGIRNRHVGGRPLASAVLFAAYAAVSAVRDDDLVTNEFSARLLLLEPLRLALGATDAAVAIALNPWRSDWPPARYASRRFLGLIPSG